jgi:hypothetical protein
MRAGNVLQLQGCQCMLMLFIARGVTKCTLKYNVQCEVVVMPTYMSKRNLTAIVITISTLSSRLSIALPFYSRWANEYAPQG